MLGKFWEGLGGQLAGHWASRVLTPAFAFWFGGLAAWAWRAPGGGLLTGRWPDAVQAEADRLQALPTTIQVALVVAVLLGLATSAVVAERLTAPLLRLLEGYWPRPAGQRLRDWRFARRTRAYERASALAAIEEIQPLTPGQADELARLERWLRERPATLALTMPTRLGDLLRSAEARPRERFGLDSVICWPYLWLVLDDSTRRELGQAREALNGGVRVWLWSALFAVWTVWAWWALPVALLLCAITYRVSILSAAQAYGDLLEATFALHRDRLYLALRWPVPSTPAEELADGGALTGYLWRGLAPEGFKFEPPLR
jgi:hypothetical protein